MIEIKAAGRALLAAAAVTALVLPALPATAKPVVKTRYVYYTIAGFDASSLHDAMVRYGPHVNGENAYAATEVTGGQDGVLEPGRNSCAIRNYVVTLDFTLRLPRLKKGVKLSPDVARRWSTFDKFVREHEERHRQIWIACAADLERSVKSIKARSCDRTRVLAQRAMDKAWEACGKKHDAFDVAQRHPLMKQPFIQSVAKSKSRTVSLKAPRANFRAAGQ
jgi:predicted secreted Zn-dependent protease